MAITITHAKTNAIADWTQAQLDAIIAGNPAPLPPVGTTLAQVTLPSDWNDDHVITGLDTEYAKLDGTNQPFTGTIQAPAVKALTSGGLLTEAANGTDIGILGAGNTANVEWYGNHNYAAATQDTIAGFLGAGKTLSSLATATYPSLTELSYVKGVTSAVQTQLDRIPKFTYFV